MNINQALAIDGQEQSLTERLIRSAAHAAACNSSALYVERDGKLVCSRAFGAGLLTLTDRVKSLAAAALHASATGVLAINDALTDASCPDTSPDASLDASPDGAGLRFVAAIPVQPCGVLLVADPAPHPGFSPAQRYVLVTHGLQLGAALSAGRGALGPVDAHTEQARAERLRLLESVVVNANDAILITEAEPIDLPGPRIVYCNAAFTRTTGYSEAEVLGRTPRLLQPPHADRQALDRLRTALERWEPVEVELLNVRKDGSEFWVELSIVPVADERGFFTHWVSVQRDVSQRRLAEETATRARIAEVENRALEAEIRERKLIEQRLQFAAFHDDLTRLHNRAYLMDRLTALIEPAEEGVPDAQCCILFLDLDRFKLVNDSLGHRAGDLLLMEVARRLRGTLRATDTLARVGGDEFAVLIEGEDAAARAVDVAEAILAALSRPVSLGKGDVFTGCSVGIAHATGHHMRPEELLRDADIAMYVAKKQGGKAYAIYNADMHAGAVEALLLQTDLRHAIARAEFQIEYQPIYNATSGKLIALEALVRWHHPKRGVIGPDVFIPIAEDIGTIREIDRWVMRESCSQLRAWEACCPELDARLSINVSGDELRHAGFLGEVRAILAEFGLQGGRLQLEITESVFLRRPELIGKILSELRALGIRVALDDFGTGYSSLGYLDRYEFDALKIDRTFVVRMLRQERAMAIMEGIVRLGSALRLDIVAEGVETEAQLAMLRSLGCANVQGYLLGRPMPAPAVTALLRQPGLHAAAGLADLAPAL